MSRTDLGGLESALHGLARNILLFRLVTSAINLLTFPVLRRAQRPPAARRVSLLVPARDEAHNLVHTLPGLLAQRVPGVEVEVLLLNDGSGDGTRELARALGEGLPPERFRVLEGAPLPPGWHGKPWACLQLARAASGEVLVFTDADVRWETGALAAALGELEGRRADLLTVWPRQRAVTWGERLLVPLVDALLLGLLPYPLTQLSPPGLSAGCGQVMAFTRAAYWRLAAGEGGHHQVRAEVLEDVRLAFHLKQEGGRLALALGGDLIGVRMYRGYREAADGFAKGLPSAHRHSRGLLALSWGLHLLAYTAPLLLLLRPAWRRLLLLGLAERLLIQLKTGRLSPAELLEVPLSPLGPLAALPVYLRAAGGGYRWKGRQYRRGRP